MRTPHRKLNDHSGFTLIEIMISAIVLALVMGGALAGLIQSRRLTEGSIGQNSVVTIMQGYIEQMKNMDFANVAISPTVASGTVLTIPTVLDKNTPDALTLSRGSPPTTLPAVGTTPTGAVDNQRLIDINDTPNTTLDDLHMNLWVWVQDLTGSSANVQDSKSITIIYTWQFYDGGRIKSFRDTLRSIRSVVPSF